MKAIFKFEEEVTDERLAELGINKDDTDAQKHLLLEDICEYLDQLVKDRHRETPLCVTFEE